MATSKSTVAGYVNGHGQENLGSTGRSGDHNQTVYEMKCRACRHLYGANGADIFQKKCPACQGGAPGPGL